MITFKQIANNRTALKRTAKDILYLVIHDTSNPRAGASAEMHYQYFDKVYRGASADFFVDDKQILQINDYFKFYTWAVGDGRNAYGINNRNSISIELCINSDSNYNTAFNNTVRLTKYLLTELNIPIQNVVRHYDASKKPCPGTMASNNWQRWTDFKARLSQTTTPIKENDNFKLQRDLSELGYVITIDGIVGPQTMGHILDFQRVTGLHPDGVYGTVTNTKMQDIINNDHMSIIYRSVNILSRTSKKGQDPLIIDRQGWMKKATTDIGIFWLLRKMADYVS